MTLINNCRGIALENVQRSEAPNDAWQKLESRYRAKGTREILRLLQEIHRNTMEPGGGQFKSMMEINRLAANLHRLSDESVTKPRKCVLIVAGLSVDFEKECRMLEYNTAGFKRTEIERAVENQYNRLLR